MPGNYEPAAVAPHIQFIALTYTDKVTVRMHVHKIVCIKAHIDDIGPQCRFTDKLGVLDYSQFLKKKNAQNFAEISQLLLMDYCAI